LLAQPDLVTQLMQFALQDLPRQGSNRSNAGW
jgi:hypothetical protein